VCLNDMVVSKISYNEIILHFWIIHSVQTWWHVDFFNSRSVVMKYLALRVRYTAAPLWVFKVYLKWGGNCNCQFIQKLRLFFTFMINWTDALSSGTLVTKKRMNPSRDTTHICKTRKYSREMLIDLSLKPQMYQQ